MNFREKLQKLKTSSNISRSLTTMGLTEKSEDYWLRRIIEDTKFEWLCAVVIITNAITIGISAEETILWSCANPGTPYPANSNRTIYAMNKFYVSFYTLELSFKIWVWRCDFFVSESWRWNMFDLLLVLSGLYDVLTEFVPIDLGSGIGITWLRVLRIVKTLKLLRVIRVMRFFQVLRRMVSSIVGSMGTLFWSILMISIMLYMFALCFLNAVTIYLNDNKEIDDAVMEGIDLYWSSVSQAMMTLFWAVTGGADWEPLAAPVRAADGLFYSLFFFYIAFAAFAVLNVLTGMFVMQADEVAQADEENVAEELVNRHEVKSFRHHVLSTVTDRPGFISADLITKHQEPDLSTANFEKCLEITHADAQRVFAMMDPEQTGFVHLEEFIKGCCHANGNISGLDMVLLMNETKHVSKQLLLAMDFIEDRFNETLYMASDGAETAVESWNDRVKDAKRKG